MVYTIVLSIKEEERSGQAAAKNCRWTTPATAELPKGHGCYNRALLYRSILYILLIACVRLHVLCMYSFIRGWQICAIDLILFLSTNDGCVWGCNYSVMTLHHGFDLG